MPIVELNQPDKTSWQRWWYCTCSGGRKHELSFVKGSTGPGGFLDLTFAETGQHASHFGVPIPELMRYASHRFSVIGAGDFIRIRLGTQPVTVDYGPIAGTCQSDRCAKGIIKIFFTLNALVSD